MAEPEVPVEISLPKEQLLTKEVELCERASFEEKKAQNPTSICAQGGWIDPAKAAPILAEGEERTAGERASSPAPAPDSLLDQAFLNSWVSGKSPHTCRAYLRVGDELLATLHPGFLKDASLSLLQEFIRLSSARKPESLKQRAAIIKSLFSFAQRTGYLKVNLASFIPKVESEWKLSERYLSEEEVIRMITLTRKLRDRVILRVLYSGGLRVSELVALNWEHVQPRENGTLQLQVLGKGSRVRQVLISPGTSDEILLLKSQESLGAKGGAQGDSKDWDPIFCSSLDDQPRLSVRMVREIIKQASLRAGIRKKVSPHWLRHAHASHALDRGAPLHLVQATLGHRSIATTGKYLHARPQESSGKFLGI